MKVPAKSIESNEMQFFSTEASERTLYIGCAKRYGPTNYDEATIDLFLDTYCVVNKRSLETVYYHYHYHCRGILGVNFGLIRL